MLILNKGGCISKIILDNTKNMKILLINKFLYKRGGSETHNFTLAEALEKNVTK